MILNHLKVSILRLLLVGMLLAAGGVPGTAQGSNLTFRESTPSDAKNVAFVSHLQGNFLDIQVEGLLGYAAARRGGLQIIDLSDPLNPAILGSFLPDPETSEVIRVAVAGQTAFVVDRWTGLYVLDVSDPVNPKKVGSYRFDAPEDEVFYGPVHVNEEVAYLSVVHIYWEFVEEYYSYSLNLLDVSDPANPEYLSAFGTDVRDMVIREGTAFIADGHLRVLDVGDPAYPAEIGNLDGHGTASGIALEGNLIYIAEGNQGVLAVDVENPGHPVQVGSFLPVDDIAGIDYNRVAIKGNFAYLSAGSGGLRVLYIQDRAHLGEVGYYQTQESANDVDLIGDFILLSQGEGGLDILQYTGPEAFYRVSGQVTNTAGKPIPHVIVSDGEGHSVRTGADGIYTLSGLEAGGHTLAPAQEGYTFSPAERIITVPPDVMGLDFTRDQHWIFLPFAGKR